MGFTIGPCIGGRRGVTRVFSARDERGVPCALKTLAPEGASRAPNALRFAREIEAHTACSGIVGVARGTEVGEGSAWLRIDWAHGGDVAQAVEHSDAARTRLAARTRGIVIVLARALVAMHSLGVAHRDIKPSNLLLDRDDVWLTDFGIAARRERQEGVDRWIALPPPWREKSVGTPPWAAPELSREPPLVTPASDVYSLGMLWQWLHDLTASPPPQRARDIELITSMLHAEPTQRPSATDVLSLL